MKRYFAILVCAVALQAPTATAGDVETAVNAARAFHKENGPEIVAGFAELLAIPNNARDIENIRRNADAISTLFEARGFDMQLLETGEAPPLIYGERKASGATRTIAIYVHYDGQSVESADWANPPFEPTLYSRAITDGGEVISMPKSGETIDPEWRLYARSAGDDKAPIPALLAALDALDESGIALTSNIKLVFDGEEEDGSGSLDEYLVENKALFENTDLWLFCDGPMHQSRTPQLVFGVRGVTGMDVTVYGPNRGLHSGHYGNWAPGPGWRLSQLLAGMKDDAGKVRIKDFYKSSVPLSDSERAAIIAAPNVDEDLREEFGLILTEGKGALLAERIALPALNLKGLKSAEVGAKARNVIPPSATASIGIRLVDGNDPDAMLDLVEAHIERNDYHIVRDDPTDEERLTHPLIAKVERHGGYPAVKSDMSDERFSSLIDALKSATDHQLILTPTLGGSLPLYMFETISDAPIVILPIANHDNNQHAADENIRLGNLFFGVEAYAAILTMD